MKLKKMYRDDGEWAIVEEGSQAEQERSGPEWSDKPLKTKKPTAKPKAKAD